jgi:hypothetical protein
LSSGNLITSSDLRRQASAGLCYMSRRRTILLQQGVIPPRLPREVSSARERAARQLRRRSAEVNRERVIIIPFVFWFGVKVVYSKLHRLCDRGPPGIEPNGKARNRRRPTVLYRSAAWAALIYRWASRGRTPRNSATTFSGCHVTRHRIGLRNLGAGGGAAPTSRLAAPRDSCRTIAAVKQRRETCPAACCRTDDGGDWTGDRRRTRRNHFSSGWDPNCRAIGNVATTRLTETIHSEYIYSVH